jgi:NAD(P)-dependent dehydrogenase (short-subunit alcohol dehydrogenase family)
MARATARAFAAEGAKVAVTDFSHQGAQAVADAIAASGGTARAWALDVADPQASVGGVLHHRRCHPGRRRADGAKRIAVPRAPD